LHARFCRLPPSPWFDQLTFPSITLDGRGKYVFSPEGKCHNLYRVIKKSLCTWWLLYRKLQVMFEVSLVGKHTFIDTPHYLAQSDCLAVDRQGQGNTRLTLTPSVVPNSNDVIIVSHWNCLKYICVFFIL
jgi:hypothetical protein